MKLFEKYKKSNDFAVIIYLGTDKIIRFIPKIEKGGLLFPLPIGEEYPLEYNYSEIGATYLKVAKISQSYNKKSETLQDYNGKKLAQKLNTEYKAFPKFKTNKNFNRNHICGILTFTDENKIVFRYLSSRNGEFICWKDDDLCNTNIPINSTEEEIGKAIISVYEKADRAYPKLNILGKSDSQKTVQFVVPNNSTTLFVKNQNSLFLEIIKELTKDNFDESEYSNGLKSYSAASLSSLFNKADLSSFNNLTNNCDELFCFASYSIPGFYGFFHFENGKCIRGYAILDEDGTVQFNIGEKSYVETALKLNLPPTSDEISEDGYDDLNETIINDIAQIWLSK